MFCSSCGYQNGDAALFCTGCGARLTLPALTSPEHPDSSQPPPEAPVQEPAASVPTDTLIAGFRLAGIGDRLIAAIFDSILIAVSYGVIGMAVATRLGGVTESGFALNGVPATIAIGSTLLAGFLYYMLTEGIAGATLGKAIAGIQVRQQTGAPCGVRASMIRNALRIVDAFPMYLIGFLVAIFSKARQRLGDHAAGTIVVTKLIGKATRAALVVLWFAVIAGGVTAAYEIHQRAPEMVSGAFVPLPSSVPSTSTGRLRAGNLVMTTSPDGPARSPAVYSRGDNVYVKYALAGFGRDAQGRPHLLFQMQALDPSNILLHEPWTIRFNGPLSLGAPVNAFVQFELVRFAPPGSYKILIKVHDDVRNANLEFAPALRVDGPAIASPQGLEIRDFQVSRIKGGPAEGLPMIVPGSSVSMQCNVFGLQFQGDHTKGRVRLKLFGPDAEVLMDELIEDLNYTAYYHPPATFAPITNELQIPAGAQKGVYTAQYSFTDDLSSQSKIVEAKFEVQ